MADVQKLLQFSEWDRTQELTNESEPYRTHLLMYAGPARGDYMMIVRNTLDAFLRARPELVTEIQAREGQVTYRDAVDSMVESDWLTHSQGALRELDAFKDYEIVDLYTDRALKEYAIDEEGD